MIQTLSLAVSDSITTADTNLHAFAVQVCRLVVLKAPKANTGVITIAGVNSTAGIDLSPGDQVTLWISNLSQLAYKAATSGDKIQYLISK